MQRDYDYERDRWGRDYDRERGGRDYDRERDSYWTRVYEPEQRGWTRDYDYDRGYRERRDFDRGHDYEYDRGRPWSRDYDYDRDRWGRREYGWDWGREYPGGRFYDYDRYSASAEPQYRRYGYGQPWRYGYSEFDRGYAGRGPRGYQRSDERMREDVCDRLCASPMVDASDIDVRVSNGEVTLTGTVASRDQKRTAEDIAESVWGVHDVHNQLRVTRQYSGTTTGGATAHETTPGTTTGAGSSTGSQTMWRSRLRAGMQVVGSDQGDVGQVKEVRDGDFVVDRSMARDVCIPFTAIRDVAGDRVVLDVPASDVDKQGWPNPALSGANNQTR